MSCYEYENGHGVATQKDLRNLRRKLMNDYNKDVKGIKPKELKAHGLIPKAHTRTKSFPILGGSIDLYSVGVIHIDVKCGKFTFDIEQNNHSVDNAKENSTPFRLLKKFMSNMKIKGKKYGAKTYYWNEYMEDGPGHSGPGDTSYYGGWVPKGQRKLREKTKKSSYGGSVYKGSIMGYK